MQGFPHSEHVLLNFGFIGHLLPVRDANDKTAEFLHGQHMLRASMMQPDFDRANTADVRTIVRIEPGFTLTATVEHLW